MSAGTQWDLRSFTTFPVLCVMLGVPLFLFLVPIIKLLRRTGHHALWCLLAIFPVLNLIALWIFAYEPWPTDGKLPDKLRMARSLACGRLLGPVLVRQLPCKLSSALWLFHVLLWRGFSPFSQGAFAGRRSGPQFC